VSQLAALAPYLLAECWRIGAIVETLLDSQQVDWVARFWALPSGRAGVWLIGRQRGKSYAALTLAVEFALSAPNRVIRYAALTGKSAAGIVLPTLRQVLATCPPELQPKIDELRGVVVWPNGSTLTWAGTDNEQFDRLRGPFAHLILLDECAFYADLERVESALLPQLTTTGGKVLYLTTPPESVGHVFVQRWRAAQACGAGVHSSVLDSPRLGPGGIDGLRRTHAERLGLTLEQLEQSTFWRREYLAEIVTDESRAAMPSWTAALHAQIVRRRERPRHWDGYQALDPGKIGDPHAWLGAWHDPESNTVHIERELECRSATTSIAQWAEQLKDLERELYGVDSWDGTLLGASEWRKDFGELPEYLQRAVIGEAPRQPYLRVGDNDHLLLNELAVTHGLSVVPTRKDDKHLSVEAANELLRTLRVTIDPGCVRLIEQLYSTVWNRTRSQWERTTKDHGDLIDCLVYLLRNVRWHRDCRPAPFDTSLRGMPKPRDAMDALRRGMF